MIPKQLITSFCLDMKLLKRFTMKNKETTLNREASKLISEAEAIAQILSLEKQRFIVEGKILKDIHGNELFYTVNEVVEIIKLIKEKNDE